MRRFAAHYIWYKKVSRMHYIEVDDQGLFRGVFPLEEEIAGTAFFDGVLVPILPGTEVDFRSLTESWERLTWDVRIGDYVRIYRLSGISLASAKLGTDDGGGNGHIERL